MIISSKNSIEAMERAIALFKSESVLLEEKANDVLPKPMVIGSMPHLYDYSIKKFNDYITLSVSSKWYNEYTYYSSGQKIKTVEELDKRKAELLGLVDKLEADIAKVREDNKDALANNIKIREKITLMMNHIGIDGMYDTYAYKSGRSRTKTKTSHISGFVDDLQRVIRVSYPNDVPNVDRIRKQINDLYNAELNSVRVAEKEKIQSEEKVKKEHEFALLRAKYTPKDALSTKEDILDAILDSDKYFRLGHYLLANREDWNEGCGLASHGLNNFEVDSDVDKLIDENLSDIIENWYDHLDGRIFRDCEYNYDVIFGMVENQDLIYDHRKIMTYFQ